MLEYIHRKLSYCFTWHNMSLMSPISLVFNFAGSALVVKVPLHKMVTFLELRGNWKFSFHRQVHSQNYMQSQIQEQRQSFCVYQLLQSIPSGEGCAHAVALLQARMGSQAECGQCQFCTEPSLNCFSGHLHVWLHSNLKAGILLRYFLPSFVCFFSLL